MKRRVPIYTIIFAWIFLVYASEQHLCAQTCIGSLTVPLSGTSSGLVLDTTTATIQHVACFGGNTGSITANVVGGSPGYNYSWADNSSINSAMRTSLPAGSYTVYISDANSCTKSQSFTITEPPATVIAAASATTNTICNGTSTTLQASATGGTGSGYTYTWNNGAGAGTNVTVSPANTTTYTVTVTDPNGCSSTASTTITVNNNPLVSITNLNSTYCSNAATIALAGSPAGGTFLVNGSPAPTFSPSTAPNSNVVNYHYTDGNGCSGSASQNVAITTHSTVTLTQSGGITSGTGATTITQACLGTPITLTAATAGPAVTNYQWQRNGVDLTGQTGTAFTTSSGWGVYRVRVTNINTCITNADTFSVSFRALPNAQAGTDKNICTGNSVMLGTTNVSSYTYSWASNMGAFTSTISNPVVSPTNSTTTYTVTVSQTMLVGSGPSTLTCTKSDEVIVNLLSLPAAPTIAVSAPTTLVGSSTPTLCEGAGVISLLASNTSGATHLQWLKNGGQQTLTTNLTGVYNVSNTSGVAANYTAKVKAVNGCFSPASNSLSTTVYHAAMPTITPAGTNNIILLCFAGGTSATQLLTASVTSGTPTYNWYQVPGTTPIATGPTYNATISNTATSKTFNVKAAYSNGCVRASVNKVVRKNTICKEAPSVVQMLETEISVYPNPTNGLTTINLGGTFAKTVNYEIFNTLGQSVLKGTWNVEKQGDLIEVDLTKFANGVYHYQISDEYNTSFSDKIIKE
ncbi:MAG: T9SS type A sorting domain-containing protein [Bacteroidia bacterium]